MWKYILSYFRSNPNEDSDALEDAYNVLKNSSTSEKTTIKVGSESDEELDNYETINKIGKITKIESHCYTIDGQYEFTSELEELFVGSKVSYQVLCSKGEVKVINVHLLENDWNVIDTGLKKWFNRTLVCSVNERNGRTLCLKPGEIQVDLNTVRSEFIPVIGDWVEIDVKCECDANVQDLSGKILEVNFLRPLRMQLKLGQITQWNSDDFTGSIDRNVFFTKESLCCGYWPNIEDKVVVEMIESEQRNFRWRALKVVPDYLHNYNIATKGEEVIETHDSITITDNMIVNLMKLKESKLFLMEMLATEDIKLICVKVPRLNGQVSISENITHYQLKANTPLTLRFQCTAKSVGQTREIIIFQFENFVISRWISINVHDQWKNDTNKYNKPQKQRVVRTKRETIKGQHLHPMPKFIPAHLPAFPVPEKLLNLVTNNPNNVVRSEVERLKPCLVTPLNYINYEDKFHTLLHLDECFVLLSMHDYDQVRACFVQSGEYLLLEIENLAERRPSVMPGDRIVASNVAKNQSHDFEGVIHKIGKNHVFIKFSQMFHDSYNGEDYSVYVVASRITYKREHFAIKLAVTRLGKDWLFPSQVGEKEAQLHFRCADSHKSGESKQLPLTKEFILEKIRQFDDTLPVRKLEWYNPRLNHYQKEAVKNVLLGVARPLPYIIFGPPGTGKTVTVVEIILQILTMLPHSRILLCAPSNSAADLLALRLIDSGVLKPGDLIRLVAMSAVATVPDKLAPFCATANLEKEGTESQLPVVLPNGLVKGYSSSVLGRHKITVSTCASSGILYSMGFAKGHFSHVVIDEAGQTSEPNLLIPLAFLDISSGQAVLAGDPRQLGPVVISKIAAELGLEESFLERMISRFPYLRDLEGFPESHGYDPRLITKLIYNYRSLPALLKLPSLLFYHDELLATIAEENSCEVDLLNRLADILPLTKNGKVPSFVFHGVKGENLQNEDSPSWFNPSEASQVFYYVNELYRMGLKSSDIGIIAPYKAQCKHLVELLKEAEFDIPKIGTVEEFQGQEYNVIILSTVRSSKSFLNTDVKYSMGFISDPRRLNVAITRAKSLLIIVGNPVILSVDRSWRSVINYAREHGSLTGCVI